MLIRPLSSTALKPHRLSQIISAQPALSPVFSSPSTDCPPPRVGCNSPVSLLLFCSAIISQQRLPSNLSRPGLNLKCSPTELI